MTVAVSELKQLFQDNVDSDPPPPPNLSPPPASVTKELTVWSVCVCAKHIKRQFDWFKKITDSDCALTRSFLPSLQHWSEEGRVTGEWACVGTEFQSLVGCMSADCTAQFWSGLPASPGSVFLRDQVILQQGLRWQVYSWLWRFAVILVKR